MSRITSFFYLRATRELIPRDKLFFDDSLPEEPAETLSQLGSHSVTAKAAGLAGRSVTEQLTYAAASGRMFVTKALPLSLYLEQKHVGVLVVSRGVTAFDLIRHVTTRLPLIPFPPD